MLGRVLLPVWPIVSTGIIHCVGRIFVPEFVDSRVPKISPVQGLSFVLRTGDGTVCALGLVRLGDSHGVDLERCHGSWICLVLCCALGCVRVGEVLIMTWIEAYPPWVGYGASLLSECVDGC